jgi:hypothetical protein
MKSKEEILEKEREIFVKIASMLSHKQLNNENEKAKEISKMEIDEIWKTFSLFEPREKFLLILKNSEKIMNKNKITITNYIRKCNYEAYRIYTEKVGKEERGKVFINAYEKVKYAEFEKFIFKYNSKLLKEYFSKVRNGEIEYGRKYFIRYAYEKFLRYLERRIKDFFIEVLKQCNIDEWETLKKHISIEEINGIFENIAKMFNENRGD